jgi:hypothetical protein
MNQNYQKELEELNKNAKNFGLGCSTFIFGFPISLFNGLVIMKLWNWFVVPAFDVKDLRYVFALGLALLIRLMTFQTSIADIDTSLKEPNEFSKRISISLITSLTFAASCLFWGWIFHMFI